MERRGRRESRAVPAPDANAELVLSMQVISIRHLFLSQDTFLHVYIYIFDWGRIAIRRLLVGMLGHMVNL
jgi:hypothetical protein